MRLELRHRVQLLDVSESGALVACDLRLPVGTRGLLRTEFASVPFSTDVTVTRQQSSAGDGDGVNLGTQFGSMEPQNRQSLERFLRRAKE